MSAYPSPVHVQRALAVGLTLREVSCGCACDLEGGLTFRSVNGAHPNFLMPDFLFVQLKAYLPQISKGLSRALDRVQLC